MEYNYNQFALLFDSLCLQSQDIEMLKQYGFHELDGLLRGYIDVYNLSTFILDFDTPSFIQECILEWNYEYLIPLEVSCIQENTAQIKYETIVKPNAWQIDMLDNKTDVMYSYPNINFDDKVDLWILDTGVFWKHHEFEVNQVIDMDVNFSIPNLTSPHGTGSASAAAGKNYGSAKNVQIYNYPVCRFGGSCGSADIEKGLLKVLEHVNQRKAAGKRSVINMSFGSYFPQDPMNSSLGQYYNALFKSIDNAGGVLVTSAGNSNQDACMWLYSFSPFVISVGSLDQNFNKSGFSNWGKCVDIWSFGSNVPLAYSVSDPSVIQFKSGTSFSSPLVAGLIVNLLYEYPWLNKEEILNFLYFKYKGYVIPYYSCGNNRRQCCQGDLKGTRFDFWCRSHSIYECDRSCKVKDC